MHLSLCWTLPCLASIVVSAPTGAKQARTQARKFPAGSLGVDLNNATELTAVLDSDSVPLHNAAVSLALPAYSYGVASGKSQKVDNSKVVGRDDPIEMAPKSWPTSFLRNGKSRRERRSFHWLPAWRTESEVDATPEAPQHPGPEKRSHWQTTWRTNEPEVVATPETPRWQIKWRNKPGVEATPETRHQHPGPEKRSHWLPAWRKKSGVETPLPAQHPESEKRYWLHVGWQEEPGVETTPKIPQPAQHDEPGAGGVPGKKYGDCPGNWCRPVRRRSLISRLLPRSRGTPQSMYPVQNTGGVAAALAAEKEFGEGNASRHSHHNTQNTVPAAKGSPHAPDGSGVKYQGDCPGNWCRPVKE